MPNSYNSVVTLGLSILFAAVPAHAEWYYDASCASHTDVLKAGMQSATSMVGDAVIGFGSAAPAGSGNIWSFPNTEARDLAGRTFGAADASASHYNLIKNGFTYISQNYGTGGDATTGGEKAGDIVFYCDLSRLEKQPPDVNKNVVYKNKDNPREVWKEADYDECNFNGVFSATFHTTAMAVTDLSGADYAITQICPWYLKQVEAAHVATTKMIPVRNWWYNALSSITNAVSNLRGDKVKPIDLIALFDVTLVHEMTHAIQSNNQKSTDSTWRFGTDDGDDDTTDGYGWDSIYSIRNSFGWRSADSWAYFALGIQQMQQGNRINSDGSVGAIQGGAVDLTQNNNVLVGSAWAPTKRFQPRDHSHRESLRSVAREMRRSATGTAPFSVPGGNSSTSAFSGTAPGTGVSTRASTSNSVTKDSTSSTSRVTVPSTSSSSVAKNTTTSLSGTAPTTRSSTSQSLTASSNSTSPISTKSPASSKVSQTSSTGSVTSSIVVKSSSSSSSLSVSASGNTSSTLFTSTNIVSTSGTSSTTIATSVPVSITSSSSSSQAAASDISYIFSPTTTDPVTATWAIPIVDPSYTPTTSTEAILSIVSATGLYIPSITNLAAFPTIKLKDPDPKDKDNTVVPFVKITLPKDKCSPLPKPSGGGLLGLAFHVASDVVNGVLDAACHLVFPVLNGIDPPPPGGVLPPWVSLDIFPPEGDFPEDPEDPTSTATQSSAKSTSQASSSSSSSSSCSASAVPKCTASCAITSISGTATSSCATVCATVTACSATASTTTVSSSASVSANSVIDHFGPSSTAWFGAQQDILASLISAAPSSLPTNYFSTVVTGTGSVNSTSSDTITSNTASGTISPTQTPVSSHSTTSIPSVSSSSKTSIPISSTLSKSVVSSSIPISSSAKPTSTSGPTITTSVSPSATLCQGNQVEDNCEGGVLPSATPYSGNITPQCDVADGDKGTLPRINATQASNAVNKYCSSLVDQKLVLTSTSGPPKADIVEGATENNGQLALSVIYDVNYCPTDKSMTEIDFGKLGYDECYMNLYTAISEVCAQDSTWGDYDKDWTIEGGVYGADCGIWAMTSQT